MSKLNVAPSGPTITTHEGGRAARISPEQELRRSVMACLLWEDSFYESGESIADRIRALTAALPGSVVAPLALEARSTMNLRHVPLLLCREMARAKTLKAANLAAVIQRADELAEFLAIYWKDGRTPLSAQVKKGLALAFPKFGEYALAKYDRAAAVRLRDVLFLCHARPGNEERAALWKRLVAGELATPDTWEVALSGGAEKKEAFTRLLRERKLGALALIRNLRNMDEAGVDPLLIAEVLGETDVRRVLPFRFIAAANAAPSFEPILEQAMFRATEGQAKLAGRTVVLVDVSGSMSAPLSGRSTMSRTDAASGLAMVAAELCERVEVVTFSDQVARVPPRHGFALRDAIAVSQPSGGTYLGTAVAAVNARGYDRLIVVTDEQAHDDLQGPLPGTKAYMLNVAAYQNGVGYGRNWTHIDGFSDACVRYIAAVEGAVVAPEADAE